MRGDTGRPRWWLGAGLVAIIASQIVLCGYFGRFTLMDDAFVAFRYVHNLLHGHGLVFNVGERTEGYTSFLWVALLCGPAKLGMSPVIASRLLGAIFFLLTIVLVASFRPSAVDRPAWSRLLPPLLIAVNPACALWAVHGIETTMFMFWLTLAVRADLREHAGAEVVPGWSGLWYGLATLTRPEGALVFGASFLFWLAASPRRALDPALWRHVGRFALVVVPHELWRIYYYGELLPNTYYAKVGLSLATVSRGGEYVLDFFVRGRALLFVVLVPAILAARRDRRLAFLTWILLAFLAIVMCEGGDFAPAWRFVVPILPVLALLASEGLFELAGRMRSLGATARPFARGAGAVAVLLALLLVTALYARATAAVAYYEAVMAGEFTGTLSRVGVALRRHLPPTTRIALSPIGAVPYYSRLYAYDMLGLTNHHIAHQSVAGMGSGDAGHEKGDGAYILDQAPEIILFGNVTVVASSSLATGRLGWVPFHRSEQEIATDPRVRGYVPDELPLDDGRHVIFLRRRDFAIARR